MCSCMAKSLRCWWLPHLEGALMPGREDVWKKNVWWKRTKNGNEGFGTNIMPEPGKERSGGGI